MNIFERTTSNIAAWNLEGYGGIPDERLARQVEGIAMLDAEVLALVEISPLSAMDKIVECLACLGVHYDSVMLPQQSDLNIGVIYKKGVEASNPRFIEGSDLNNPSFRKAFVVDMKVGRFDFILICVHLKSGRALREQKIRDQQAKVISAYIDQTRAGGFEDIILTGDFNMIPGQDISNFHFLGGDDVMDFLSSWDLQDRFSHILPKGRANLLDGFAITRTFSQEYIRGSLRLFPMHWTMDIGREEYKNTVSDHLPFVASFRIDKDKR